VFVLGKRRAGTEVGKEWDEIGLATYQLPHKEDDRATPRPKEERRGPRVERVKSKRPRNR